MVARPPANYGGMGVGPTSANPSDADQIAVGELLTFTFLGNVKLLGISTLFADDHVPFGTGFANGGAVAGTNKFLLNGVETTFFDANQGVGTMLGLGFLNTWTFAAIAGQPEFYVSRSGMAGRGRSGDETPLPAAVWLFGGVLGGPAWSPVGGASNAPLGKPCS